MGVSGRLAAASCMRLCSQASASRRAAPLENAKAAAISVRKSLKESLVKDWLNHAAGFFRALALVQADVLFLQGLMLVSSKFTVYRLAKKKDTVAVAYACLFTGLSAYATFRLLSERLVWLDEEEHAIWAAHFEHHSALTQPMFKKLMSCAEVRTVSVESASGASDAPLAAPALSDYFSAKYPFRGDRVPQHDCSRERPCCAGATGLAAAASPRAQAGISCMLSLLPEVLGRQIYRQRDKRKLRTTTRARYELKSSSFWATTGADHRRHAYPLPAAGGQGALP